MFTVEQTIAIDRPLKDVFAFLADHTNDPLWRSDLIDTKRTSSGDAGVGQTFQASVKFLGRSNIIVWYARSRLWVLSSYALTGLMPFFVSRENTIRGIIVIWALATLPQTMVNVTFTLVMGAVAGPTKRMELMSRRWTTLGVVTAVSVSLVGWTLDQISFPINYQVVFMASFIGGLISYFFSTSIVLPEGGHVPSDQRRPWYAAFTGMRQTLAAQPAFARFAAAQFIFRCGMSMAIPLLPLYWVRVANASDASIGLINTVSSGVLMIAYALWITVSRRRGQRMVLLLCGMGLALYPVLVATSGSIWQLVIYAGMAGIFAAGTDLVLFDLLIATVAPRLRGPSVGLYHTTTYIATFAAPLLATAAADSIGIVPMLFVAAALRAAGTGLFAILGIGRETENVAGATPA